MQLVKVLDLYLTWLDKKAYSQSHIDTVRIRLERFTKQHRGAEIQSITRQHIKQHFQKMEGAGLAQGTLAGHKSTQRAFWRWCKRKGHIKKNPSKVLKSREHDYSYAPVRSRAANADDLQRIIDALPAYVVRRDGHARDLRDAALVSLTIDSTCRRGELWNLRVRDVTDALAHPERMKSGRMVYHTTTRGKTGGDVPVRFFSETADYLAKWLAVHPQTNGYVFVNIQSGERLHPQPLYLAFKRICQFAGVPMFRFQAVRKRNVTDMIEKTGDAKMGQLAANHKDERTTQIYYNQVQARRVDDAAGELSAERRESEPDPLARDFFGRVAPE